PPRRSSDLPARTARPPRSPCSSRSSSAPGCGPSPAATWACPSSRPRSIPRASTCSPSSCRASSCTGPSTWTARPLRRSTSATTTSTGTAAKGTIYARARTARIYNVADPTPLRLVEEADVREGARAIGIGLSTPGLSELGVIDGILADRAFLAERRTSAAELATLEDLAHLGPQGAGPHVVIDALAAAALARAHGVEPWAVRDGLRAYRMGSHRAQHLATIDGIGYVDDTKATNPAAAAASLRAAERVVWIAGGDAKGADLGPLIAAAHDRLVGVVLLGRDDAPFTAALSRHAPEVPVRRIDPGDTDGVAGRSRLMEDAVQAARALAEAGDVVLLAPAAASIDQFRDYAERGDLFAAAVTRLPGERAGPRGGPAATRAG